MRDWAFLHGGLLHDIFTRLPADADATSFRHACRGWRAVAEPGALVPGPWFLLRSAAANGRRAFVRPAGPHRITPATPCASRGWLAVSDGKRLFLRDPISRAEVPLPAFDDLDNELSEIFLSDDPLDAPAGRWTAFAFFKPKQIVAYPGRILAFYRPGGGDADQWVRFDLNGQQVAFYWGLEFFRGRAYVVVGVNCTLAVCDVDTRSLVASAVHLRPHMEHWEWSTQQCLVECAGDLLAVMVTRYEVARWPSCYVVARRRAPRFVVKVMKVMFAADSGGFMPVMVSDVRHIGDYALFVPPRGHAFALPASGFPAVRSGCVYHFATKVKEKNVVRGMAISDLLDLTGQESNTCRKLPLAGKWHPVSWLWPRRPSFDTAPGRGRRQWRS
nr:unnamed protein product [Digitaria exilis]